jgi:hypothetical protein
MRRPALESIFGLCGVLLAGNGCAVAPLAISPIMSAVQVVVARGVDRTVPASVDDTFAATVMVLTNMALAPDEVERDGEAWTLRARSEGLTLYARFEPLTARMTRLSIRTERGGLSADRETSVEIHAQVARLVSAAPPAAMRHDARTPAQLEALHEEVRRLRAEMKNRPVAPAPSALPTLVVEPASIVSIPTSYGLPVQQAAPPASRPAAPPLTRAAAPSPNRAGTPPPSMPPVVSIGGAPVIGGGLTPADVLTPVGAPEPESLLASPQNRTN